MSETITLVALFLAVLVQALVVCGLFHTNMRLLRVASSERSPGRELPAGTKPSVDFVDANTGVVRSLRDVSQPDGRLILVAANCGMCDQVLRPGLGTGRLRGTAVYCHGGRRDCLERFGDRRRIDLLVRHDVDPVVAFDLATLPAVVHIDGDGRVVAYSYPMTSASLEEALASYGGT